MKEVNPRLGMVTHIEYEEDLLNEVSAGVRAHYDGLFLYGAPDVVVVNVTKEAIWARKAAIPGMTGANVPHPRQLLGLGDGPLPMVCLCQSPGFPAKSNKNNTQGTMKLIPTSITHRTFIANPSRNCRIIWPSQRKTLKG